MSDGDAASDGWVGTLAGPVIAAAGAARIGLSLVSLDPLPPRVLYINHAGADILGQPREMLLNRPATAFLAPGERDIRTANLQGPRSSGIRTFETTALNREGKPVPLEVSLVEIQHEGRAMVVVFFRDISERHQAVSALARSEARFRQLIEQAPDAIWITDGRRMLFVNPATVRLLDYQMEAEVLALRPAEIVHPDDQTAMRERSMEMLRTRQSLPPRAYRVRRRDGAWLDTEVHSMPIEWEGVPAILGFARDVTARKELEGRLVRNDRLAALGTLLAGIAHEMNNPLTFAMLGLEQATTVAAGPGVSPEIAEHLRGLLADVRDGVERVAGIVRQLRVSARPSDQESEPVDVRLALESALRVAGNEIRHRARLMSDLGDAAPVTGNRQRLEQVFLNLLVNATQALPEGRSENEIRVVLRNADASTVLVEVSDNGVGMPPETLAHVFDPFFTTKRVGIGMGLGLSICHSTVTAAGGTIAAESSPERGTVFRVILPRAPARSGNELPVPPPRTSVPATVGAGSSGSRRRVLVVDDEVALCQIVERMLAPSCQVEVATDARAALALLGDPGRSYDIVLCDLMMPGMTGMELYDRLGAERPEVLKRFVFMTGGVFTPGASAFLSRVDAPLLEKPFDWQTLETLVGCRT